MLLRILSFDFIKKLNATFSLTLKKFAMQFQDYALISSHHLEIESGRYTMPLTPANQRFCASCPGVVGDEYHFRTECVPHSENRNILFVEITKKIPNFLIMSNKEIFISILTVGSRAG